MPPAYSPSATLARPIVSSIRSRIATVNTGSTQFAGTERSKSFTSNASPMASALPLTLVPSGNVIVSRSSSRSQSAISGISAAFEIPDSLLPSSRTKRKRRSPTVPSGCRSISSGECSLVDFTGVMLKPATVGIRRGYLG